MKSLKLISILIIASTLLLSQSVSLKGVIKDTSGKEISMVRITLTNQITGKTYTSISGNRGDYIFRHLPDGMYNVKAYLRGYIQWTGTVTVKGSATLNITMRNTRHIKPVMEEKEQRRGLIAPVAKAEAFGRPMVSTFVRAKKRLGRVVGECRTGYNTEEYNRIYESGYRSPVNSPLSTFSIDVDTASYSNIRRFLNRNQMPPKDSVRIEEMLNYFSYSYKNPGRKAPFSVNYELAECPWDKNHHLLHIGLKGRVEEKLPDNNLVFLIDVSGSMNSPSKLPLLIDSFDLLLNQLNSRDRVAIVVYAGAAGVVLPSTPCNRKEAISSALRSLRAGGSTAGGAGINMAYRIAEQNFIKDGNNRIILATDGDFNVGLSSTSSLVRMIEEKRKKGIFLTILGFGMGNYKDGRMEQLADKGNGNYYYIDSLLEARKVLCSDMTGTLFTIAKDVKIQIEFNPGKVKAYRLIGYENRTLKAEDFNDDKKDAGELGSGHTVTALYEIIPAGSDEEIKGIDKLKYQKPAIKSNSSELCTLKLRYKSPKGSKSRLIKRTLRATLTKRPGNNFYFSAAVAQFGMVLRDSEYKGNADYKRIIAIAEKSKGNDTYGYRSEFIRMVKLAMLKDGKSKVNFTSEEKNELSSALPQM